MADDDYARKMESLQQYIPFLDNMITQLKDPSKKNREQQLSKMESLHAMITDRKKKLKIETLNKCEDVISKLYLKVNHKPLTILKKDFTPSPRSTPASPSPSRDIKNVFDIKPLPIPTERLEPESRFPKVDVYSSAAESLNKPRPINNSLLNTKYPDMSKPPISLDDLKDLEEDVHEKINEGASLNELNSMRNRIAHKIIMEQMHSLSPSSKGTSDDVITTATNNLSTCKLVDKGKKEVTVNDFTSPKQSSEKDSPRRSIQLNLKPKQSPKVFERKNIFDSILTTIDDKIIGDKKKTEMEVSATRDGKVKIDDKSSADESKKKEEKPKSKSDEKPSTDEYKLKEEKQKIKLDEKSTKDETKKKESTKVEKLKERRSSITTKDQKKSEEKTGEKIKGNHGDSSEKSHEHKEKSLKNKGESKDSKHKEDRARSSENDKRKDDKKKVDKRRESTSLERKSKSERKSSEKTSESECKDNKKSTIVNDDEHSSSTKGQNKPSVPTIGVKKLEELREPKVDAIASLISRQIEELKANKKEAINVVKDSPPVFKRLADKYNPKPRKPAVDPDIGQAVTDSIEANMKKSPPKIPILNRLTDLPPPPPSLVKCSQLEPEMPNSLQTILSPCTTQLINTVVSQFRQSKGESERMRTPMPPIQPLIPQPVPKPSVLSNPPLQQIPSLLSNPPLLPNLPNLLAPKPLLQNSLLMSPNDNFVSEYVREDYCGTPNPMRPEIRFDPPANIPAANRFMPSMLNAQRFNQSYGNFNQNQMDNMHQLDYYPPNAPLPANQYNGGPPLLSPETPHYQEHKHNSFGMPNRDFMPQEDLRWRLEENRNQWDRRDFEPRYRGPATYREFREMRENSRDPRVARDTRDRDPRDSRESRDPRERDPRDQNDIREPRDNRDIREPKDRDTRDPRINRDRDPRLNREFDRSRTRGRQDYRPGRYDSKFDRIYARTNRNRSRSRSNSRSRAILAANDKESFTSPLDSLYSGKEEHKTGKGYGKQSFRIPKIKKEVEPLIVEPTNEILTVQDEPENDKDDAKLQISHSNDQEKNGQESDNGDDGDYDDNNDTDDDMPEETKKDLPESKEVQQAQEEDLKKKVIVPEADAKVIVPEADAKVIVPEADAKVEVQSSPEKANKKIEMVDTSEPTCSKNVQNEHQGSEDTIGAVPVEQSKSEKQDASQVAEKSLESKPQESKPPAEQMILAQFFANLLGSQDKKEKKTALYSLIRTFSDSFSPKVLSKISNIIQDDDGGESSEDDEDLSKKNAEPDKPKDAVVEKIPELKISLKEHTEEQTVTKQSNEAEEDTVPGEDTAPEEDAVPEPELVPQRKLRKRIKRLSSDSPKDKETNEEEDSVHTGTTCRPKTNTDSNLDSSMYQSDVVVTVGERIKSRKRMSKSGQPKKKWKSELDKLHEDIQDMFIRDGVLTATGKRMCHLLKDDPHALSVPSISESEEPPKIRKKPGPKPKVKNSDSTEVNTMRHVRVVIPKIPESEMQENEKSSRRYTRSMTLPESEDDASTHEAESTKEASDFENDSGSESSEYEKETATLTNEETHGIKIKRRIKRKRGGGWASGIIKKKKKKSSQEESTASAADEKICDSSAKDFLEPDKDYYVDFTMQKSHACKLCDFKGKFITTHYKTVHPDSEVLSSRFTPSVAAEAITDSKKNLSKYESCAVTKGAKKIKYVCRFCSANTEVFPTLFYDHLSTHTGEYRHICPNCAISFCGAKTLKFHMNSIHKEDAKPIVRKSYNSTVMFGYICGECNYVQITEKSVEEHVNIYHLVRPNIYKINLSSYFDEDIDKLKKRDSSESATHETEGSVEEDTEPVKPVSVKSKPGPKKKMVKELVVKPVEVTAESQPDMAPPKRRKPGPKPGPKSKKKLLEKQYLASQEAESDTTDTESISSKSSDKDVPAERVTRVRSNSKLDLETILPGRSKRAAKAKAQEKLKVIMEQSDNLVKRKPSTSEDNENNECNGKNKSESVGASSKGEREEVPPKKIEDAKPDQSTEVISEKKAVEDIEKVVKKEIDMNVFTCKTDLHEENKKIQQERLQKMDELNRSVGSRTSLNFVDKLCNRLSKNDVLVKQEPKDDTGDGSFYRDGSKSPVSMPVLEKNPPTLPPAILPPVEPTVAPPVTPQMKNPVMPEAEDPLLSTPSFDVTQKNDRIIVDMIEKLKGKLSTPGSTENDDTAIHVQDDDEDDGPPPLTHVNELVNIKPSDSSTKTLQIGGLVKVIKTTESTTFCCLVPPCVFSTDHKDVFQRHCREMHGANTLGRNSTLCETCGVQIETTLDASLLENLFKHTITEHADFLNEKNQAPEQQAPVQPHTRVLRIRRLSGDALSVNKKDWEDEIDNDQSHLNASKPPDNDKENQAKINEPTAEEPPATFAEIEATEDNPFPFKIAGVMSLAGVLSLAEPPPPLTPIAKQGMHLVVKEAKLSLAELAKPRKTQKAMAKFIEEVGNLYKCPHHYCLFTTNFRDFLERHLKAHNTEQDAMIPCVYCDMKTPWEHVPMHIDIRHANCRFACCYCLYRAAVKEYVFLHQDRAHPNNDYSVIALPNSKSIKKFAIADSRVDPKTLCEPYRCTTFCNMEFLFENEFRKHLLEFHSQNTFLNCGYDKCRSRVLATKMTHHWSTSHHVSLYQCGYCKMSCSDIKLMYHHFSKTHQNLIPDILIRMVTPMPDTITLGYSPEAFRRMRKIVTIPGNLTSDDKSDKSPASPTKSVLKQPTLPFSQAAIQIVTSLPQSSLQKAAVIPTVMKSSTGSFCLVTASSPVTTMSNSMFLLSGSTSNNLSHAAIVSPVVSVGTPDMMDTLTSPAVHTPVASTSVTPSPTTTPTSSTSTAVAIPRSEKSTPTTTEAVDSSIPPLEHVTLGEENQQEEVADADVDPLDLGEATRPQNDGFSSEEESDAPARPEKTDKEGEKSGLLGYQLYRCAFCDYSSSNSNDFKKHASRSQACRRQDNTSKPYECVHCGKCLRNPHVFVDHVQVHGVLRFSCSLCGNKFPTPTQAKGHMKTRHNVNQTSLTPLNPSKTNPDTDEYIIKPKLLSALDPKENPQSEPVAPLSTGDTVYTPDEIDKIPIRSIFSSDIRCGICNYSTKVRTNLVRHLQFHSQEKAVPDTAPVNPVPCLEKNEKMFDKMVNLASSSHSSSRMGGTGKPDAKEKEVDNVPEYISSQYRYACCAQNCSYICPEEGNLRHHLMALHDGEMSFTCVHCKADITPTDVDNLVKHLKLHGLQLYKCYYCSFVNHLKSKAEKHVNDYHADLPNKVVTVRSMESEPKDSEEPSTSGSQSTPVANQTKPNKPWRCCMCKTRSGSIEGIQNHVLEKHEIDTQYKCALCAYKTDEKDTFANHFRDSHTGQEIDFIHVYRKVEDGPKDDKEKETDPFDTTPLWQRDRPRVRHIRGILFDESTPVPAKSPKKPVKAITAPTASSAGPSKSNLELAIESVATGTADILKDDSANDDSAKDTADILKDDELIEQVNKIMKYSREPDNTIDDGDVIVIEDEEETLVSAPDPKSTTTKMPSKRKGSIEVHGISKIPRIEDVIDLANTSVADEESDEYSEKSLKRLFGPFGQPLNRQLRCPVCYKFKSKRISDFIFHVFKEKKVYRFKCAICSDESITYRYMAKHVKEHQHSSDFRLNIIELQANSKLEVWIQMLISYQCSKIMGAITPVLDAIATKDRKVICRYCSKWFRTEAERNEHAIFHWRIVPLGCDSCHFLAFTKQQVERHFERCHSSFSLNIIEKGPTVVNEIKYTDDLHKKEAIEGAQSSDTNMEVSREEGAEPGDTGSWKSQVNIAEVILPGAQILEMEDESQQDGTVEGMSSALEETNPFDDTNTSVESSPSDVSKSKSAEDFETSTDDLVFVTRTDANVPVDGDIYCCEYCPFMSNSETLIMSHISGSHEHMHIKFKMLNSMTCENNTRDYVGCSLCPEVGSEVRIRRHHLDMHDGQTFLCYRYTCHTCGKRFMKLPGLKTHSIRTHPGVPVRYTGILNESVIHDLSKIIKEKVVKEKPVKEAKEVTPKTKTPKTVGKTWKIYQCNKCPYRRNFASNALNNVRVHVRQHYKPFFCGECSLRFKSHNDASNHYNKEHPGEIEQINFDELVENGFQAAIATIYRNAIPIEAPPQSSPTQHKKAKPTARKSTSAPYNPPPLEEYSFYGLPVEPVDLTKISTSVDINGMCLNMSADKLGRIFDMQPHVQVENCNETVDLTTMFDS